MIDWLRPGLAEPKVRLGEREVPLEIRRHPRAKRLTMRLSGDGAAVRITMPSWCRTRDALAFAEARREWLTGQLASAAPPPPLGPGASFPFRGVPTQIVWEEGARRAPRLKDGAVQVGGPAHRIEARLRGWLEGEALHLFGEDLAFYCARAGVAVPALALSRARWRWGSCSARAGKRATIRLNWRLAMAPDAVRRSVVAHEVAHLLHFDHSPSFHAALARLFEGDLAAADLWLKRHGASLYRHFA